MSSQSLARPRKSNRVPKKRKKASPSRKAATHQSGWLVWWPLLAGVLITVVAVRIAEILPLTGPSGLLKLQLLYPFALLLKQPQLGIAEQTSDQWSQIMLYAQWVLYGVYASVAIRWTSRWKSLLQLVVVHLTGFGALWWLSSK